MTTKQIGLREARAQLGPIANRAHIADEVTYLTRNGRPIAAVVSVSTAIHAGMRTIESTVDRIDVDETAAERIREAVDAGTTERETYSLDEIGQKEYWIRLVRYDWFGNTSGALLHDDPENSELLVWDDYDTAEMAYEQRVREASDISGWTFDETDVELS